MSCRARDSAAKFCLSFFFWPMKQILQISHTLYTYIYYVHSQVWYPLITYIYQFTRNIGWHVALKMQKQNKTRAGANLGIARNLMGTASITIFFFNATGARQSCLLSTHCYRLPRVRHGPEAIIREQGRTSWVWIKARRWVLHPEFAYLTRMHRCQFAQCPYGHKQLVSRRPQMFARHSNVFAHFGPTILLNTKKCESCAWL